MAKSELLHVRLTHDLIEKLQAMADAEYRPINNYIEYLVLKKIAKADAANLSSVAQSQGTYRKEIVVSMDLDLSLNIASNSDMSSMDESEPRQKEIEELVEDNFADAPDTLTKIVPVILQAERRVLEEYPQVKGNTKYIGEIVKLLSELRNVICIDDMSEQDIEDYVYTKYKAMVEDDFGEQKR